MSKDVENLRKHERVLNHIDIIKNKLSSNTDNKIKVGLLAKLIKLMNKK